MTNRYPGTCACGAAVAAGAGEARRNGEGRWQVVCRKCLGPSAAPASPAASLSIGPDGQISIPYTDNEGIRALLRSLPPPAGTKSAWDTGRKCWRASVSQANLRRTLEIAERLGLAVAPELRARAAELTAEAKAAQVIPGLYPFQVLGVEFLASGAGRLLADDQGTGKTVEALAALPRAGDLPPVLCVAPAAVKYNWRTEAARWAPQYKVGVLSGRGSFRWPTPGELIMINYDLLPKEGEWVAVNAKDRAARAAWEAWAGTAPRGLVLIVDEAHNCRNDSLRSRRVRGLAAAARNAGGRVWGLTGTPLLNRPEQLWRVLQSLGLASQVFGSWNGFVRLFQGERGCWGGYEWGKPLPEVPERLRRVTLRRTKAEVLPDLPPKRYQQILVNGNGGLDAGLRAELDRLWAEWQEVLAADCLPPFEEFSRVRAALAESRVKAVEEFVEGYEDAGEPLVVFSAHVAPVKALAAREGWAAITGETPAEARTEIVRRFQAGELKGLACTMAAAGVGITLTRASTAVFVDLDWTPAINSQAQDRLHRIGQTAESVLYVRFTSDHPLDLHIHNLIVKKMDLIDRAIERLVKVDPNAVAADADARRRAWEQAERESQEHDRAEAQAHCRRIAAGTEAEQATLTPERVEAIKGALDAMLAVCDGAVARDGEGFSKPHVFLSRWLERAGLDTEAAQRAALALLRRYPRQLRGRFPALWD